MTSIRRLVQLGERPVQLSEQPGQRPSGYLSVSTPSMANDPPTPYTNAVANAATSPNDVNEEPPVHGDLDRDIADGSGAFCEPIMLLDRSRPKSLTSSAPLTLKRSVMVADMSPLSCI